MAHYSMQQIIDGYLGFGLTPTQATNIAAVQYYEGGKYGTGSQGASSLENGGVLNPNGAYGLSSWNGARQQGLLDYANSNGLAPDSLQAQQGFTIQELNGMNGGLSNANSVSGLVSGYEVPAAKYTAGETANAQTLADQNYSYANNSSTPMTQDQPAGAQTDAPGYTQPGQGVSMPGQNFNQPNLALDNVAAAGSTPGDTGGLIQSSAAFQAQYGAANAAQDTAQDAPDYTSGSTGSVGGFVTPSQDMGPYSTQQNQAAGLDLNIPGAGTNPNAFDTPSPSAPASVGTTGPDNIAPAGSTPGDTGGMGQASQTAGGGDYPSGVSGGLGPDYYSGGGGGSSSAPDPSAAVQAPTNQAPAAGDLLGFNDPSQTYTMPDAVNTPAVQPSQGQSETAAGDQTVPQAIDKQASVESKAIASAATAQSKAITSAQTSADKSASSLAQQAIKSAQSIASGQQASSKEQTASNQAASQTMLSQVKDLFVRFFLGAGGLVLIAAAVWYFAGRPTPPMPVMRAVRR
jgi:Phage tail lysozyme